VLTAETARRTNATKHKMEQQQYHFSLLDLGKTKLKEEGRTNNKRTSSDKLRSRGIDGEFVVNVNIVAKAIFHPFNFDTNTKQIQTITFSTTNHYPLLRFVATFCNTCFNGYNGYNPALLFPLRFECFSSACIRRGELL